MLFAVLIFEGRLRRLAHAAAIRRAGPRGLSRDPMGYAAGPGYGPTPGYPHGAYQGGTAYAPIISFVPMQMYAPVYPEGYSPEQYGQQYAQAPEQYGQTAYMPAPGHEQYPAGQGEQYGPQPGQGQQTAGPGAQGSRPTARWITSRRSRARWATPLPPTRVFRRTARTSREIVSRGCRVRSRERRSPIEPGEFPGAPSPQEPTRPGVQGQDQLSDRFQDGPPPASESQSGSSQGPGEPSAFEPQGDRLPQGPTDQGGPGQEPLAGPQSPPIPPARRSTRFPARTRARRSAVCSGVPSRRCGSA